jgi:hypothetical protein
MMAETLRAPEGSNVSPAQFHAWLEEYEERDREVADAVAARKDLRAKIKANGCPLGAFDRARRDAEVSAGKRDHEEHWYQTMMAWLGKPVPMGGQATLDLGDETNEAILKHQLEQAERSGYERGRKGNGTANDNPWPPGSEGHQRWHNGYMRGQTEIAATLDPNRPQSAKANGAGTGRRGRPAGSKNKPKGDRGGAAANGGASPDKF